MSSWGTVQGADQEGNARAHAHTHACTHAHIRLKVGEPLEDRKVSDRGTKSSFRSVLECKPGCPQTCPGGPFYFHYNNIPYNSLLIPLQWLLFVPLFLFSFFVLLFLFQLYLGIYLILLHKVAHLPSFWTCGKPAISRTVTSTPWPVPLRRSGGRTRNSQTLQSPSLTRPTSATAGKMDSSPLSLMRVTAPFGTWLPMRNRPLPTQWHLGNSAFIYNQWEFLVEDTELSVGLIR